MLVYSLSNISFKEDCTVPITDTKGFFSGTKIISPSCSIISSSEFLYFNALYKQVKEGNAPVDNSSITDIEELYIWNEWNKLRGNNQELVMNKYCDHLTLIINWQNKKIYKYD